jgi:hypothetical protein
MVTDEQVGRGGHVGRQAGGEVDRQRQPGFESFAHEGGGRGVRNG